MSDMHLDDEALSAHLDGEGPHLRAHLDGCAVCTARLAELQRVRAALGAPVTPPPAGQRDAAIARALDAVDNAGSAHGRPRMWAGGIAAAILLVLGAVFGLSQLSHGGGRQTAALRTTEAGGRADAKAAAAPPTTVAAAQLGDLGALADTAALRARVQPTVAQLQALAPKASGAAPAAPESGGQFRATGPRSAPRRCMDVARALDPANVSPAAVGTATWQGTPAEVLVYAVSGRPGAARVYVLAQTNCRLLEFQSYAP